MKKAFFPALFLSLALLAGCSADTPAATSTGAETTLAGTATAAAPVGTETTAAVSSEAPETVISSAAEATEDAPEATDWPEPTGVWAVEEEKLEKLTDEQKSFYRTFYELDVDSAEAYFQDHPETLENGYPHVLVNEAGLKRKGTSIVTKLGETVLAIDAENQILIIEVRCDGARGVLAVAKRPEQLHLFLSEDLPRHGQTVGDIASQHNGILAMTGSGFIDEGGTGNGGNLVGWAMSGGKAYGDHGPGDFVRLELREDNRFYLKEAPEKVDPATRDAMEFQPSMIINGEGQDIGYWTDKNPRACIGQSRCGEILMLGVEGRGAGGSWGCSLAYCRETLLQHDCLTALNCDGGTTAIVWYRGEPIMRCSNAYTPQGRYLPDAWVYVGEKEDASENQ